MSVVVWAMIGIAFWHFAVLVPDRFWGGIVGAFLGALAGAILLGLVLNGLDVPGRDETELLTALEAIPGALLGIAAVYFWGARRERAAA